MQGVRILWSKKEEYVHSITSITTSAITPTHSLITAALGWAPLIPPRPDVRNTFRNVCKKILRRMDL